MNKKFVLLAIIITGVISGCANSNTSLTETAPIVITETPAVQTATPATATIPPVSNVLTYTDSIAGFSIDYPADWFLESSLLAGANEKQNYTVMITSWDILNATPESKGNLVPNEETKIDISVSKQNLTLEEVVAQQKQQFTSSNTILFEKLVTLDSGIQGMLWEIEGLGGPVRTLIVVLNGNVIYISGYGDLQGFDAIALTFRTP